MSRRSAIELVVSQWPFLFSRFNSEPTDTELEAYIERFRSLHARNEPYATVAFMQHYSRNPVHINRMAQWMKETEEHTREHCVGAGMISPSTGFRFVLSALFLIKPMPCPYQVCGKFDDAVAFVRGKAAARGLEWAVPRKPWADLP